MVDDTGEVPEDMQSDDPFAPQNIPVVTFIMLSRIYDVLLADLETRDPSAVSEILAAHARGDLLGVPPILSGRFLAQEQLDAEKEESGTA